MTTIRSTYPLFPTDDGWPYPDTPLDELGVEGVDDNVDLDALELHADPHAFEALTPEERELVARRFGLGCPVESMKTLARTLGCSHAEVRDRLGRAIDKLRARLTLDESA